MTPPKLKHALIQGKLRDLFRRLAEPGSYVETEMTFRPLLEHELWVADVAYLSAGRFREADPEDNIRSAPELVVEVLSRSNTAGEITQSTRPPNPLHASFPTNSPVNSFNVARNSSSNSPCDFVAVIGYFNTPAGVN